MSAVATMFHPASAPDYLPESQLHALQRQRLRNVVRRAYENVELFRSRMDERGVRPDDIGDLEDIVALPFMQKTDLRDTYPYGLCASPMSDIVRLHASSGTTGKPIVVAYTADDLKMWAEAMVRCFVAYGLHSGDIIQNSYGYGLFTGGLGAHYGAEALGATVIPTSGGNTDRQIMVMRDFGVTAICCTPSYFLHVAERARALGVDFHELPLRAGIFGAEPWTEGMRRHIQEDTGIRAFDIYGLTEIIGPGVGCECQYQDGLHLLEDHFYPEIVDPVTGESLPDGERGELVFTTLSKQAMPMIRFRTHDVTRLIPEPCPCGRTIRRMERVRLRTDDMIILRGVNVFPSQIEAALLEVEGTLPHYQITLDRARGLDTMAVKVEVTQGFFGDTLSALEQLQRRIAGAIEHTVGLHVGVQLVEPQTLARSEGKAKRVIDNRPVEE
jgi:phenylacetate-CoA ligase